jgi:hypothetical protein
MPIIREQVEVRTFRKELYAEERMCLAEALGERGWVRGSRVCDIVSRALSMAARAKSLLPDCRIVMDIKGCPGECVTALGERKGKSQGEW